MGSADVNQCGDLIGDISEHLLSLDSSDSDDRFGDSEAVPRVGDEYQVEIPPLIIRPAYLSATEKAFNAENGDGFPFDLFMGLAIPSMWINEEAGNVKTEKLDCVADAHDAYAVNKNPEFQGVRETQNCFKDEDLKVKPEPLDAVVDNGLGIRESSSLGLKAKKNQDRGPSHCLVPGSCGDSWSYIEKATFLLALYIFEKNFVQVKRVVESKKMGDILEFYYGRFYKSEEYRRWSECRRIRSRRCGYGQRIFSGWRQQELLSRLTLQVSDDHKTSLLEASKTYGEGKMSLEDYVSSLKTLVGVKTLVEAVGIGKGKLDLTGIAVEPLKSNQVMHARSEIPTGKACNSLTSREIIKFLTGDYRLSKARSNDLFWEAVWPRLLARGWHSEQPKNYNYAAGNKNYLVFLMPGVKKFSRRRLAKGTHYFDSVTDVLSKVASEPGLLELDTEEDEGNRSKEEDGSTTETKLEQDDLPARRRHSYLQPRTPSRNTDVMKFTVVDTSLAYGKTSKVRELRTLPLEISTLLTSKSHTEDNDEDASEVSTDEEDNEDRKSSKASETIPVRLGLSERENLDNGALDRRVPVNCPDFTNVLVKSDKHHHNLSKKTFREGKHHELSASVCIPINMKNFKNHNSVREAEHRRKDVRCHLSKTLEKDNLDYSSPVAKRCRRLTSCSRKETRLDTERHGCYSDARDSTENVFYHVGLSQDKLFYTGSSEGSPTGNGHGAEYPNEKFQARTLIDLNLPQLPPDFETGVFMTEEKTEQDDSDALKTSEGVEELQPNMNTRRHSTRNRPPTTKVLEALANGFLTINTRGKSKRAAPREKLASRPYQRADHASVMDEGGNDVRYGGDGHMLEEFQLMYDGYGNKFPGY
ncbi:hypothetical protein RJ639_027455 [Escallonia herrerae]|uniref:SANT domain-containing protein n=1 Tax=Escallonia herrerae TaxID=1293975 RepID=A0AA89BEA4_9ASTE|nr:hypothetical protein RJ639_027455 [Escallonia herrerae]